MTIRSRKQSLNGQNTSYSHLEDRRLLAADASLNLLDAAELAPTQPVVEYVEVEWQGETLFARNDQWLIWQEDGGRIQTEGQNSIQVGDETALAVNGAQYIWAAEHKIEVTKEISSGIFVLSGTEGFSYDLVAQSVAEWMPNAMIQPDFRLSIATTPNDPDFGELWGLNNTGQVGGVVDADINALEAWEISTGSSEVVVGVIDTGIDYTHPDLVDNIWTNPGEIAGDGIDNDGNGYIDDIHGWDFVNDDNDPIDDQGHGTHVAGTIGAVGNNDLGVVGVSQDVSLLALKFLGSSGFGDLTDAIEAVEYANGLKDLGTNLVMTNNSWGGGGFSAGLQQAIENALDRDILFVAAAGNSATDSISYPAAYEFDNVISVAATDRIDQLAGFSNFSPDWVDLAAPGVDVLSTQPNNSYAVFSGTSMASPHVAGALALLAASEPDLTALELRERLLESVDFLPQLDGVVATAGRLNANSLLDISSRVDFLGTTFVAPGSVDIELFDPSGFAANTLAIIESSSGDFETLPISATGGFEFTTSINSVEGTANSNDGILQITSGDTLTVTYFDADDGDGVFNTDTAIILIDDYGDDALSATPVDVPFDVAGNVEVAGDEDWFSFSTVAGMEYEFLATLGSLGNSVVSIYDTDGLTLLATNSGLNTIASFVAPSVGTYFVSVGHLRNAFGTYDLSGISRVPESTIDFNRANFGTPGLVDVQLFDPTGFVPGATVIIEAASGDIETVSIIATGGTNSTASIFSIEGTANAGDGILQVTSGDTLTATYFDADDGFGGTFTATGSAAIFADDHGNDASSATAVGSSFNIAGDLEISGDEDWFRFNAIAGSDYEFGTTLDGLGDSTLTLYDTDGVTELVFDDDGGDGLASRLFWQASRTGSYYIAVRAFANAGQGTYQLTGIGPGNSNVNFNSEVFAVPGSVGLVVSDLDGFAAGTTVTIEASSGDSETLAISAGSDLSFATSINSVVGSANANDGTLQVSPGDTLTATYVDPDDGFGESVTNTDTASIFSDDHGNDAASATAVSGAFDVSGNLDRDGDQDWFSFQAIAGLEYDFRTTLNSLSDSTLRLYDTDGVTELEFDDDGGGGLASRIRWQFAESDTYYLAVRAFNDSGQGTYQLTSSASSSVVLDVIVSSSGLSSNFIDSVDGEGIGAGNGLGYSLVGNHQLGTLPWLNLDTLYLQFSDDVSASIADGDILLTGTNGGNYDLELVSFDTETNTAEFLIDEGIDVDRLVISILDGAVANGGGGLLDGEWDSRQTEPSGDGNVGGQFDFFFNVLPGDEDGNGQVTTSDAFNIFTSNTDSTDELNRRRDIDGSGQINVADSFASFANSGVTLPQRPVAPTGFTSTSDTEAKDAFFADRSGVSVAGQRSQRLLGVLPTNRFDPAIKLANNGIRQDVPTRQALVKAPAQGSDLVFRQVDSPTARGTDLQEQTSGSAEQNFSVKADLLSGLSRTLQTGDELKTLR